MLSRPYLGPFSGGAVLLLARWKSSSLCILRGQMPECSLPLEEYYPMSVLGIADTSVASKWHRSFEMLNLLQQRYITVLCNRICTSPLGTRFTLSLCSQLCVKIFTGVRLTCTPPNRPGCAGWFFHDFFGSGIGSREYSTNV